MVKKLNIYSNADVSLYPDEISVIKINNELLDVNCLKIFQLDKNLCLQNIICIYNNINENNDFGLEFHLKNTNNQFVGSDSWKNHGINSIKKVKKGDKIGTIYFATLPS